MWNGCVLFVGLVICLAIHYVFQMIWASWISCEGTQSWLGVYRLTTKDVSVAFTSITTTGISLYHRRRSRELLLIY